MSDKQHVVNRREASVAELVADVYECAGSLRRSGEKIAASEGQTQARWQLLSVVSDRPLTVPQSARRLGVSRQAVQRVANDLVAVAHLQLRPNPEHRGSPLLCVTDSGRSVLASMSEAAAEFHHDLATAIPAEDIQTTRQVLQALAQLATPGEPHPTSEAGLHRRGD